jgi:hypothetical protein
VVELNNNRNLMELYWKGEKNLSEENVADE